MSVQNCERKGNGICFDTKLSAPPLPILQLLYISTGERIKSIASGRTVTSYKAHSRDPLAPAASPLRTKPLRGFCTKNLLLTPSTAQGTAPAPKNGQSSTPAADPQQQADNKVYAFKKELQTSLVFVLFDK